MDIVPSPNAVFRPLSEGGVILDVETGAYFEVNASGRLLWEQIEHRRDVESLVDSLVGHFSIDGETALGDVEEFLDALRQRGLITS